MIRFAKHNSDQPRTAMQLPRVGRCLYRSTSGFTLTEIMIVIGLIVILVGILATITLDPGARSQTHIVLAALRGISTEYEIETGTIINHVTPVTPDDSIERFVRAARQQPTPEAMIPSLGKEQVIDADKDDFDEILDGWGRKIKYFAHNLPDQPGYDKAFPERLLPFFVSSGPDGEWGDITATDTDDDKSFTYSEDNIYSYEVD